MGGRTVGVADGVDVEEVGVDVIVLVSGDVKPVGGMSIPVRSRPVAQIPIKSPVARYLIFARMVTEYSYSRLTL